MTTRRRRLASQILLFLLLALNIEVFCQWQLYALGREHRDGPIRNDDVTRWRLQPGRFERPDGTLYINRFGIRHPEETQSGAFRVMFIGGSIAYGWGLAEAETMARKVESLLQARLPARRVEVVNAGTPGYNSWQSLALFEEIAPTYRPDIVVAVWGYNDQIPSMLRRYRDQRNPSMAWSEARIAQSLQALLSRSATYRYLHCQLVGVPERSDPAREDYPAIADNLRYLDEQLKMQHSKLLLMFEGARPYASILKMAQHRDGGDTFLPLSLFLRRPDNVARLRAAYFDVVRECGVEALEMDRLLAPYPEDDVFLPHDVCHPSALGANVMARAIADRIISRGWLPD